MHGGGDSGTGDATPAPGWPPAPGRVAVHDPNAERWHRVAAALSTQGHGVVALPVPAGGLRPWLDTPFDLLALNPFVGWQEPAHFVALARTIAGRRPLLALTPRDSCADRLLALEQGADDVVAVGADPAEIAARAAALLRRARMAAGRIAIDTLSIDMVDRRVAREGRAIHLPLREFDLLSTLARSPDRVVPRDQLMRTLFRIDFDPGTNRLDVHMSRLRSKVDRGFPRPMLHTVKGVGYALRSERGGAVRA